jgi:hypothetical protein
VDDIGISLQGGVAVAVGVDSRTDFCVKLLIVGVGLPSLGGGFMPTLFDSQTNTIQKITIILTNA